ncbi:hypothetical protein CC2G_004877 [Coprinopsis cinerea AmutBmut pab1-1]|nr:hypothetical protein CC2G_004877 [Coprinopsis cinerea AmutBmut pab1-1]
MRYLAFSDDHFLSTVGASVLYLSNEYAEVRLKTYWLVLLVIELVCATLVSLVFAAVPRESMSPSVPAALWLAFIGTVIPFLLVAMRVAKQGPNNNAHVTPTEGTRTPSFSGTRLSTIASIEPRSPISSLQSLPCSESGHEKVPSVCSTSDVTFVNHLHPPHHPNRTGLPPRDLEAGTAQVAASPSSLRLRIGNGRSQSLLVFLVASQFAALVAFVLEIVAVNVARSATPNSAPSSATKRSSAYATLQIFRTAVMVLCIIGVMAAFLLHAYNAYLRAPSTIRQSTTTADAALPPAVDLSRMNAITVSLSTTTTTSPPFAANKRRPLGQPCAPSAFNKSAKKFSLGGGFTDIALSAVHRQVVFTNAGPAHHRDGSDEGLYLNSKPAPTLSRQTSSSSCASSFETPMARSVPANSVLMSPEPSPSALPTPVRDSKFDDEENFEPGYAYIYTDKTTVAAEKTAVAQTDPLDVGLPVPFQGQPQGARTTSVASSVYTSPSKPQLSLNNSYNSSAFTNVAVENAFSSSSSPSLSPPQTPMSTPIDIPTSKSFSNPYPTPRSTPTTSSFADSPTLPVLPITPTRTSPHTSQRPHTSCSSKFSLGSRSRFFERPSMETERQPSQCSTPTRSRESTPTPTPTRAPTPGLSLTPFIGVHVRKRDSTSSKSRNHSPSPPSSFMANLKGKAKSLSSKHDSFVQGLEGIRNGLGSSGKTKYPLRSSNSHSSLGLGISSGFKFPQLTRRASELDKGRRNRSSTSINCSPESSNPSVHEVDEGDFMDLRDPFAPPSVAEGGALRIVTREELNIRTGRESRSAYRDEEVFEMDKDGNWSGSLGRSRGQRMSAWGNLPLSQSNPSSPIRRPSSPSATKILSMRPSKHRVDKVKLKSKSSKASSKSEGSSPDRHVPPLEAVSDDIGVFEEALLAQQLLERLGGGL